MKAREQRRNILRATGKAASCVEATAIFPPFRLRFPRERNCRWKRWLPLSSLERGEKSRDASLREQPPRPSQEPRPAVAIESSLEVAPPKREAILEPENQRHQRGNPWLTSLCARETERQW